MSNSQGVTLKKHKETGQSGAILGKHKNIGQLVHNTKKNIKRLNSQGVTLIET